METTITKVLNKVKGLKENYSIGFNRLTSLPLRVRKNINLSLAVNGNTNNLPMVKLLGDLSEQEFINWMLNQK